MPIGPGGLDSNGIWQFGEDDSEALASDLLNLGMSSVSTAIGSLPAPADPAILQVVSTTKTDTFSVSQGAGTSDAITGLTASITPSSTANKILVTVAVSAAKASPYNPAIDITADGSVIASPDSPSSRVPAMFVGALTSDVSQAQTISGTSLHSPASVSNITYGVNLVNVRNATVVSYVNRSIDDTNSQARGRYVSTITLMEVAG